MIFDKCNASRDKEAVSVSRAIWDLQQLGHNVSVPITDHLHYDLVAEVDGDLKKVQVKATMQVDYKNVYQVGLATKGKIKGEHSYRRREEMDWDYLFVVTEKSCFFIPSQAIKGSTQLSLSQKYDEYIVSVV